jgi:hypothetical protein
VWIATGEFAFAERVERIKKLPVMAHLHSYEPICSIMWFSYGFNGVCGRKCSPWLLARFVGPLAGVGGFYASRRGASRRGCKLGEDRGTPRGDVFCSWVSPGGGCLGCGGGCVAGRVSGGLWRWGWGFSWRFLSCWVGGGVVSAACLRARRPAWVCGGVLGESLGSVVRCGAGLTAWGLAAVFGVGLVSGVFGVGAGGRWFQCLTW